MPTTDTTTDEPRAADRLGTRSADLAGAGWLRNPLVKLPPRTRVDAAVAQDDPAILAEIDALLAEAR